MVSGSVCAKMPRYARTGFWRQTESEYPQSLASSLPPRSIQQDARSLLLLRKISFINWFVHQYTPTRSKFDPLIPRTLYTKRYRSIVSSFSVFQLKLFYLQSADFDQNKQDGAARRTASWPQFRSRPSLSPHEYHPRFTHCNLESIATASHRSRADDITN